ncbi:MAG: hypothetical protein MRZ12_09285 [Bacteroidales bacterium]|nr:hypothetical protein [Bacteroidales bacterium]
MKMPRGQFSRQQGDYGYTSLDNELTHFRYVALCFAAFSGSAIPILAAA